jgi:hypothetical protein
LFNSRKHLSEVGAIVKNAMEFVTREVEVKEFDRVQVCEYGELELIQDGTEALSIRAHPELADRVKAEVRGRKLELGLTFIDKLRTSFLRRPITYQLHFNTLEALEISGIGIVRAKSLHTPRLMVTMVGAGELTVGDLQTEILQAELPGSGRVCVGGKVSEQYVSVLGTGSYDAAQLKSDSTHVNISGAGQAKIWATNSLDVAIHGIGNVSFYGNPQVKRKILGMGSLQALGEPQ